MQNDREFGEKFGYLFENVEAELGFAFELERAVTCADGDGEGDRKSVV